MFLPAFRKLLKLPHRLRVLVLFHSLWQLKPQVPLQQAPRLEVQPQPQLQLRELPQLQQVPQALQMPVTELVEVILIAHQILYATTVFVEIHPVLPTQTVFVTELRGQPELRFPQRFQAQV